MTSFIESLVVALVGMFVVFAALVIIIFCIKLYTNLVRNDRTKKGNGDKKQTAENTIPSSAPTVKYAGLPNKTDPELIAVITAAVISSIQGSGSGSGLKVKSVRRIGHTTPIWNIAGRNEYILSKL